MAQEKLCFGYWNWFVTVSVLFVALAGCVDAQDEKPIGMTLLFLNFGQDTIGVLRFDPDGVSGPVPGGLGPGRTDGKQMSFMPGKHKGGMPKSVEVEWLVSTPDIVAAEDRLDKQFKQYSPAWIDGIKEIQAITPRHIRRVDLTTVITPELLARIRANRSTTNLKMAVIFQGEDVTLIAEPEVWNRESRFSSTDHSPAAMDELRAANIAGSAQYARIFYGQGYYLGEVHGALSGSLTVSVRVDGSVSAVIASADRPAIVLNGMFDLASNDAVRTLKLTGNSAQGTTTLTGHIDLKERTLKGEWTTIPPSSNSPSLGGSFTAK
jgi:hypothetical protein